ncbi:uncharacterized protein [Palaemon carinicauda]|uniref:uncharacterized protein n=1 Tax=Palaemon carinicauda TaxID=392227 RepID=UPI0035B600D3
MPFLDVVFAAYKSTVDDIKAATQKLPVMIFFIPHAKWPPSPNYSTVSPEYETPPPATPWSSQIMMALMILLPFAECNEDFCIDLSCCAVTSLCRSFICNCTAFPHPPHQLFLFGEYFPL